MHLPQSAPLPFSAIADPNQIPTETSKIGNIAMTLRETGESDVESGRANPEAVELCESEATSSSIARVGLRLGEFADTEMG